MPTVPEYRICPGRRIDVVVETAGGGRALGVGTLHAVPVAAPAGWRWAWCRGRGPRLCRRPSRPSVVLVDRLARTVPELSGLAALDWRIADELESDGACAIDPWGRRVGPSPLPAWRAR